MSLNTELGRRAQWPITIQCFSPADTMEAHNPKSIDSSKTLSNNQVAMSFEYGILVLIKFILIVGSKMEFLIMSVLKNWLTKFQEI